MLQKLLKKYRYSFIVLRELVITDFKLRYQNSVLGYLWALLRPLFTFGIIYVFFTVILGVGRGVDNWGVALLLGIVMWNFFQEVVKQGLKSIVSNGGVIRKINFPKYIIVIAASLSAVINLLINIVVVIVFAFINHVEPSWSMLLVPLFILELYIFGLGLAFLLSTINVRFRDIDYIWEIATQALFYGSAIMFPLNMVIEKTSAGAMLLIASPITQAIQDARHWGVTKTADNGLVITDNIYLLITPFVITVATLIIGAWYFRAKSPNFAEGV